MTATQVLFDVQKAKEVLTEAWLIENSPTGLAFIKFHIPNKKNGTWTHLAINHHGGEIHVRIDVLTEAYGTHTHEIDDGQVICSGDFHFVESVEYDSSPADPAITFKLASKSDVPSRVTVHRNGFWSFKVA